MRAAPLTAVLGLALCAAPGWAACSTSESEPNNGQSQAQAGMCSGQALSGSIGSSNDVDWYELSVGAAGTLAVSLDHSTADDFDWYLYRATGPSVASGTTSQVPEAGSYAAPAAGSYYLEVVRYRGTGAYTLSASFAGGGSGGGSCNYGTRPSRPSNLRTWLGGNRSDACVTTEGPGLLLMGGGSDVDAAFSGRIRPRLRGGDVVVLRTSGTNAYNDYLLGLLAPDSVETLLVDTRAKADSAYVDWAIRSAEFVWIAGGDQSDSLNRWLGTKVQAATRHVYDKGGLVGGTSAGLAVLGDVIYDPDGVSAITSAEAVTDPCRSSMLFSEHFLDLPLLRNTITDTHFEARDRMGRLLAFMARLGSGAFSPARLPITGIGVDEATSMFVDAQGHAVIDGNGSAHVLREDSGTHRLQLACGQPLVYDGVVRYRLAAGETYEFSTGTSPVPPGTVGVDGRRANFYSPSDPY